MSTYLDELNESQREAVLCLDAPSLVIAGAGSGKTRVLTYKIAYLLEQGYEPWSILALTFTNKAAREMQQRISRQVGEEKAAYLWMGTFHSIFSRILRYEAELLGFTSQFTIYDAADSKSLVKSIIKSMGLDDKQYKPSVVASRISSAKNALITPERYRNTPALIQRDQASRMPAMVTIYRHYFERCRQANAMDFDDLLLYTWMLFESHPDVAQKYQDRFKYVLVDEYQDTNHAQHQIVWQLTNRRQQVCVVGDDAQSIYSFRGANIDNILTFNERYEGAKLFKLEQNYRSTETIVGAANSLIHHNQRQIHKDVFSKAGAGELIKVFQSYSDVDEANVCQRIIRRLVNEKGMSYNQIAILYRTNAQSRSLEEALRKGNTPYRIYGGLSFYQRKEVKDVIAYFRLAVNPNDEEALRRVINYPARGIGNTTVDKIMAAAIEKDAAPWQILNDLDAVDLNRGTKQKLHSFVQLINGFQNAVAESDAYNAGMLIINESGVRGEIFHGSEPEDISRQENLQELMTGLSNFIIEKQEEGRGVSMSDYLQEVSLLSDTDESDKSGGDKVTLTTVHSAKGLEYGAVIVAGMEEDLFPSQMSADSPREIEEERRLFYVAMTRAKSYLALTYAKSRMRYGKIEMGQPSRFLKEIDPRFLEQKQGFTSSAPSKSPFAAFERPSYNRNWGTPRSQYGQTPAATSSRPPVSNPLGQSRFVRVQQANSATPTSAAPMPSAASSNANLRVGARVEHDRFGRGVVTEVSGTGLDSKAVIEFENVGRKQLLLRFAKLRIVD